MESNDVVYEIIRTTNTIEMISWIANRKCVIASCDCDDYQ